MATTLTESTSSVGRDVATALPVSPTSANRHDLAIEAQNRSVDLLELNRIATPSHNLMRILIVVASLAL